MQTERMNLNTLYLCAYSLSDKCWQYCNAPVFVSGLFMICRNTSGTHLLPQMGKVFKCAFPMHAPKYMLSFPCTVRVITLTHYMTDSIFKVHFALTEPLKAINLEIRKDTNACRNIVKL